MYVWVGTLTLQCTLCNGLCHAGCALRHGHIIYTHTSPTRLIIAS